MALAYGQFNLFEAVRKRHLEIAQGQPPTRAAEPAPVPLAVLQQLAAIDVNAPDDCAGVSDTNFSAAGHGDAFGDESTTRRGVRFPADSDGDPAAPAAPILSEERVAIPHTTAPPPRPIVGGAATPAIAGEPVPKYLSLQELEQRNFLRNHNIIIRPEDEITLEHTSCSEQEPETDHTDAHRRKRRRRRHHHTRQRARAVAVEGAGAGRAGADDDDDATEAYRAQKTHTDPVDPDRFSMRREFGPGAPTTLKLRSESAFNRQRRIERQVKRMAGAQSASECINARLREVSAECLSVSTSASSTSSDNGDSGSGSGSDDSGSSCDVAKAASSFGRLSGCFLCLYGQEAYDSVNNEDMAHLLRLRNDNIGKISNKCIALIMHQFYMREIRPKAWHAHGRVLPVWRSKAILVCLETHNLTPEIQIARHMSNVTTLLGTMQNQLAEDRGGREVLVSKNIESYSRMLKVFGWLAAMKPEKMVFYDATKGIKLGSGQPYAENVAVRSVAANKSRRALQMKQR